ncbi:LysR family transcriptional regulator [Dellaglioa algida]|uniref:LysR family transcriptional regulator n=1 Tax=Dellaglioa algida TaxID=105612 RepID=A0A2C8EMJ4_9LACO|nr:LysR family transcriptional regulator [Dellaglioa algida]MDK1716541.1 LysR family transcriptional regulator [Dellaglioa algida]MDK1718036.1 LysR family transcriptional regulator [Dellaglioa algida]MDK1719966.1 LysR family transcriptional regulator [Dellaglioa algida]MDK1721483.1 LysR family transcriptional regulator [Dellaglioa algida]MDK1723295.1 LysR family transcriptional regulator [Dellaglioa algida]
MKTKQENIFSSKTLTYFLQLADIMNYTQAAQILGITQPALTQQIKKLERTVGAPLFYSVGKKLHLSDAGYTMLDATHQIYETLNKATNEIQQSTSATQGEITIGILASIEDEVFDDFVIEYYKNNPDIIVSFHLLTRKEIWSELENNKIDLAIMYLPDESIKNWKPYESKKIFTEDLLFLHHNEKLSSKKKVKLQETIDNVWVTYPSDYYLDRTIKTIYQSQLVNLPKSVARFTSPSQILKFARATHAYTALPTSFLAAHPEGKDLWTSHFEPEIKFDLSFVFRKDKDEIPRNEHFLNAFDQFLDEKDYMTRLKEINENQGDNNND